MKWLQWKTNKQTECQPTHMMAFIFSPQGKAGWMTWAPRASGQRIAELSNQAASQAPQSYWAPRFEVAAKENLLQVGPDATTSHPGWWSRGREGHNAGLFGQPLSRPLPGTQLCTYVMSASTSTCTHPLMPSEVWSPDPSLRKEIYTCRNLTELSLQLGTWCLGHFIWVNKDPCFQEGSP
jgi:hypothetical protein